MLALASYAIACPPLGLILVQAAEGHVDVFEHTLFFSHPFLYAFSGMNFTQDIDICQFEQRALGEALPPVKGLSDVLSSVTNSQFL
jgi:hypothetical protein